MWDWHWWCCSLPTTVQKHPNQRTHQENDAVCPNCVSFAAGARMLTSWLNRRRRRYLFLIICSPFLVPLFCATCPILCALEICFLICRKRRKAAGGGGDGRTAVEEGGDRVGLLQRYLEDQLTLVIGSVYECGDGDENVGEEDGIDVEYFDSARPLLQ